MCFRPTEISMPQICPQCGKKLQVIDGVKQKICPFCKTPLEEGEPEQPEVAAPKSGIQKPVIPKSGIQQPVIPRSGIQKPVPPKPSAPKPSGTD